MSTYVLATNCGSLKSSDLNALAPTERRHVTNTPLQLPAISATNLNKGPEWLSSVANLEKTHQGIEDNYKSSLASRLALIAAQAQQFDPDDRRSFIARNEDVARREALKDLREKSEALVPKLRELQFLKGPTPDPRAMLALRASKAPHHFSAGMLACDGMLQAELKGFVDELLCEVAAQPEGVTNEQAAYISAAMNRLGRLDKSDRPYSSQAVAVAVHAPAFSANVKAVDEARQRLDRLESRWSDLRRNGVVSPATKVRNSLSQLSKA